MSGSSNFVGVIVVFFSGGEFLAERRARAQLPAAAEGSNRVKFVVTENHLNKTAGSGCHDATCSACINCLVVDL